MTGHTVCLSIQLSSQRLTRAMLSGALSPESFLTLDCSTSELFPHNHAKENQGLVEAILSIWNCHLEKTGWSTTAQDF